MRYFQFIMRGHLLFAGNYVMPQVDGNDSSSDGEVSEENMEEQNRSKKPPPVLQPEVSEVGGAGCHSMRLRTRSKVS